MIVNNEIFHTKISVTFTSFALDFLRLVQEHFLLFSPPCTELSIPHPALLLAGYMRTGEKYGFGRFI
jgi:hypothetical protein